MVNTNIAADAGKIAFSLVCPVDLRSWEKVCDQKQQEEDLRVDKGELTKKNGRLLNDFIHKVLISGHL